MFEHIGVFWTKDFERGAFMKAKKGASAAVIFRTTTATNVKRYIIHCISICCKALQYNLFWDFLQPPIRGRGKLRNTSDGLVYSLLFTIVLSSLTGDIGQQDQLWVRLYGFNTSA